MNKVKALIAVGACLPIAMFAFSGRALAATVSVGCTGTNSENTAALTTAITGHSSDDTISLGAGCTFTYAASPAWTISDNLTIDGNGATIARGTTGGPDASPFFTGAYTSDLTFDDITMTNANASTSGGAISSAGALTITDSTFTDNTASFGGAIASNANPSFPLDATMAITGSTFTGNASDGGGGVYNGGTATIINSTFYGNSVTGVDTGEGAGFYQNSAAGGATIINSTFSDNIGFGAGGGIYQGQGTITVENTIVADNTPTNCENTITDGGYNDEFGDTSCGFTGGTDQSGDPGLGALADNGGPTETMAITDSSPAYHNAYSKICAAAPPDGAGGVDQRGDPREVATCDIGAFELQPAVPVPASGSVSPSGSVGSGPLAGC